MIKKIREENEQLKKDNEDLNRRFESELSSIRKENEEMKKFNQEILEKFDHVCLKYQQEFARLKKEIKKLKNKRKEEKKSEDNEIDEFNKLTIRLQQEVAVKMKNDGNTFFSNVNNLLLYLIRLNPNDHDSYFRFENDGKKLRLNEVNQICLPPSSISLLVESESFTNSDFKNTLSFFDRVIFELRYPSTNFEQCYRRIGDMKSRNGCSAYLSLFISKIDESIKGDVNINRIFIHVICIFVDWYFKDTIHYADIKDLIYE